MAGHTKAKIAADPVLRLRHEAARAKMKEAALLRWARIKRDRVERAQLGLAEVRDYYGPLGVLIYRARDGNGAGGWSDWRAVMSHDHTQQLEAETGEGLILAMADAWGFHQGVTYFGLGVKADPFAGLGL